MIKILVVNIMNKIPKEILDKYSGEGRTVNFDRIPVGKAIDFVGVYGKIPKREYWKGVEKIDFGDGIQFRFMYWTRKVGTKNWVWGQFNLCLSKDLLEKLLKEMERKGWI